MTYSDTDHILTEIKLLKDGLAEMLLAQIALLMECAGVEVSPLDAMSISQGLDEIAGTLR